MGTLGNTARALALAVSAATLAACSGQGSVLLGHVFSRWLKSSLHVAFAAFATCIVWPHPMAVGVLLLATAVVAWSRLALRRHEASDLITGAAIGLACGVVFQLVMNGLPGLPPA